MSEVIVVTSGKGGVGKTTTSANFAAGLALLGTVRAWQLTFLVVGLPGLLLALWVLTVCC